MSSELDTQSRDAQQRTFLSPIRNVIEDFWISLSRAGLVIITIALASAFGPLLSDQKFVIGEFSVPEELQKKGITGSALARRVYDHISEIQRIAKAAVGAQQHSAQPFASSETVVKGADIKFLHAEINLGTLLSQARALFGRKDTQIVGELIMESQETKTASRDTNAESNDAKADLADAKTYRLEIHAIGEHPWAKRTEASRDLDSLVESVASDVVEQFDPLSAGFYYYLKPEKWKENVWKAVELADKFQSKTDPRYLWAKLLRGMALRDGLRDDKRPAWASYCEAIRQDASFTPAWRLLGSSLRDDGGPEGQAEDLALRLVHARPSEPEGWRQLGNLRGNCASDPEDEKEAVSYRQDGERFFRHAMALGAQQSVKTDYLSFADYARWNYNRRRFDEAADYLTKAQALAPDQQSIYTTFARTLGYPRPGDENNSEMTATRKRLAEIKAKTALLLDGRKLFANFVMGELLTDAGVRGHEYVDREKFAEAERYLRIAKEGVIFPEPTYGAMYARALAGKEDYNGATRSLEEVRKELESRKKSPSYLVEWVHGELLYNKSLKLTANVALSDAPADKSLPIALSPQTEQPVRVAANAQSGLAPLSTERKAILSEARTHLVRARQLRSCGTRADAISDLIVIVERELEGQGTVSGSGGPHPALPTNRSVGILGAPQSTDSATPVAKSQARPAAPVAKNPATPACDDLGSDGLDTGELRRLAMIEIAEAGPLPLFDFYH